MRLAMAASLSLIFLVPGDYLLVFSTHLAELGPADLITGFLGKVGPDVESAYSEDRTRYRPQPSEAGGI